MSDGPFDLVGFKHLIYAEAKDRDLAKRAIVLIKPLITAIDDRFYGPGLPTDVRTERLLNALRDFTGKTQVAGALFSIQEPVPCPAWMDRGQFRKRFGADGWFDRLRESLASTFPDEFKREFWRETVKLPKSHWIVDAMDQLDISKLGSLVLGGAHRSGLSDIVSASLRLPITAATVCAVNGDAERLDRLAGILKLLKVAIPIGIKSDENDTWTCLVA